MTTSTDILHSLLNSVVSGGVIAAIVAAVLGFLFSRQRARIEEGVRLEFSKLRAMEDARQGWKIRAISELFAPMVAHLDRSFNSFVRYEGVLPLEKARKENKLKFRDEQLFLESMMKGINESARNLLLEKFFLLPAELRHHASDLINHYDRWLEIYHSRRTQVPPEEWSGFIFPGTAEEFKMPFPTEAETQFRNQFSKLWREIYEAEAAR